MPKQVRESALQHVGWLDSSNVFRPNDRRMAGVFIPDAWRKVYVIEEHADV